MFHAWKPGMYKELDRLGYMAMQGNSPGEETCLVYECLKFFAAHWITSHPVVSAVVELWLRHV